MGLKNGTNEMVAIVVLLIVALALIAVCVGSCVRRRFALTTPPIDAIELTTPHSRRIRKI